MPRRVVSLPVIMTRQERDVFWVGVSILSGFILLGELLLAPFSFMKITILVGSIAIIGYTIYRFNFRKRRWRD